MEASFFRSLEAVGGLRPPEAAREERAIDSLKTSEVHASMRKGGLACGGERQDGSSREIPAPAAGSRNCAIRSLSHLCPGNVDLNFDKRLI
jgi:hypothetical protein